MEEEKERALGLQRKERQLRQRLLSILLSRKADDPQAPDELGVAPADLLQPMLDILQSVSAGCVSAAAQLLPGAAREGPRRPEAEAPPRSVNGNAGEDAPGRDPPPVRPAAPDGASPEKRCPVVLACIPDNNQQPKGPPAACEPGAPRKDALSELDKCNREPGAGEGRARGDPGGEDRRPREEHSASRRAGSREDGRPRKERRSHKKRSHQDGSPHRRSASPAHARTRKSRSKDRSGHRERSRDRRGSSGRKRSRHRRSQRSRSGSPRSPGRHRSTWDR